MSGNASADGRKGGGEGDESQTAAKSYWMACCACQRWVARHEECPSCGAEAGSFDGQGNTGLQEPDGAECANCGCGVWKDTGTEVVCACCYAEHNEYGISVRRAMGKPPLHPEEQKVADYKEEMAAKEAAGQGTLEF